jgi:hypothetical protein
MNKITEKKLVPFYYKTLSANSVAYDQDALQLFFDSLEDGLYCSSKKKEVTSEDATTGFQKLSYVSGASHPSVVGRITIETYTPDGSVGFYFDGDGSDGNDDDDDLLNY